MIRFVKALSIVVSACPVMVNRLAAAVEGHLAGLLPHFVLICGIIYVEEISAYIGHSQRSSVLWLGAMRVRNRADQTKPRVPVSGEVPTEIARGHGRIPQIETHNLRDQAGDVHGGVASCRRERGRAGQAPCACCLHSCCAIRGLAVAITAGAPGGSGFSQARVLCTSVTESGRGIGRSCCDTCRRAAGRALPPIYMLCRRW